MGITLDKLAGDASSISITDSTGANSLAVDASGHLSINDGGNSISIDDGGGSITVDGSVTISGLAAEKAEDSAHVSGDTGHFILGVRQDTKASLAGTDGDYTSFIFDADGDLYVSDTVAQGSLATLAGAISGAEMQVDIVAPLPAGTNNIGDVDIASALPAGDNNIGNVDIVTMPAEVIEDAASAGGETMLLVGGYRQDANTSPVSADGDFHGFIFNALGELKVSSRLDDVANSSLVVTTVTVDTTVGGTNLVATALSGRREVTVQNLGDEDIWIKAGTGVTAGSGGNGFLLPEDASASYKWGDSIDLYAITASASSTVKVIEAA